MSFEFLGLSKPLLTAIEESGYTTPTPIQKKAIPAIIDGRDVMAAAQTGTGKTAGFTLPILENLSRGHAAKHNSVRALILTPTRELAAQVYESVDNYGKHLPLTSAVVFGGVKINPQMMRLRRGADILVATPGRLLDLYQQNAVRFNTLEILVLDEADRMLDMGFLRDIRKIINILPKNRQNLLFSATFSDDIRKLANGLISNPLEFSVTPRNATADTVKQKIYAIDKSQKSSALSFLIGSNYWQQVLVFTRTKHGANKLTKQLNAAGINASAIHGNKSQGARTRALQEFKSGEIQALVATDIAARGLDIDQLPHVVNYDLPQVAEDYVHRIGRTGRAGAKGEAISLVCADELELLTAIERLTKKVLDRDTVSGFEPKNPLAITTLAPQAAKKSNRKRPAQKSKQDNQEKPNPKPTKQKRPQKLTTDKKATTQHTKPKHKAKANSQSKPGSHKTARSGATSKAKANPYGGRIKKRT